MDPSQGFGDFLKSQQQELFPNTRQRGSAPAYTAPEDLIDPALLSLENNNGPTPQQASMQEDLTDQGTLPADGVHPEHVPQEAVTFQLPGRLPPEAISMTPSMNNPVSRYEEGPVQSAAVHRDSARQNDWQPQPPFAGAAPRVPPPVRSAAEGRNNRFYPVYPAANNTQAAGTFQPVSLGQSQPNAYQYFGAVGGNAVSAGATQRARYQQSVVEPLMMPKMNQYPVPPTQGVQYPAVPSLDSMSMNYVTGLQMGFGAFQQLGQFPAVNNVNNPIFIDDDDEPVPAADMQQSGRLNPGVKRPLNTVQTAPSKRIRGESYQVNNGPISFATERTDAAPPAAEFTFPALFPAASPASAVQREPRPIPKDSEEMKRWMEDWALNEKDARSTPPQGNKRKRSEVPEETAPQPKRPYLTTEDADKNAVTGGNRLAGNPEPTAQFTAQYAGGYPVTDSNEPTQGLLSAADYEQLHGENWREVLNPYSGVPDDSILGFWNEDYWNNANLELPNIDDVSEFLDSISRVEHENVRTAETQPPAQNEGVNMAPACSDGDKVATEPTAFTEEDDMNSLFGGDDGLGNLVNNDERPAATAPNSYGGAYETPREDPTAAPATTLPVPPPVVEPLPAAVSEPEGTIHFAFDDEDLAVDDDPIDEDIAFYAELVAQIAQMDREISKWQGFANASGRNNAPDMQVQYQARANRCLQRKIALDAILAETFGL